MNTIPPLSSGTRPPVAGRNTFNLALAALAGLTGYFWFTSKITETAHLVLGLVIVVLSGLPSVLWVRRASTSLPVFEVLILTTLNAYALPLLNGHGDLLKYTAEEITLSALAVILFQIVAISAYEFTRGHALRTPFWREEIVSAGMSRWIMGGITLNTAFIVVSTFSSLIPYSVESVLRAVFYGIGIICTFITARRLGTGSLLPQQRLLFFLNIAVQCVAMTATLFLVGTVSLIILALVGYISGTHRVPVVLSAVLLALLAVLHNGKSAMRDVYWQDDIRIIPKPLQLPAFYSQWFRQGLVVGANPDEADDKKLASKLIDRTSLFHMMCLVVSNTPRVLPHLNGETYADIPAQFVPRLFWPGKPPGHASTSKLSVYYGLQTEEDTLKTTIGFGMLTESYANFGLAGIAALAALIGCAIKKVQAWAADGPLLSGGGLLRVILLAWSFQTEFTLSIWIASFYQACIAAVLLPYFLRSLFPE